MCVICNDMDEIIINCAYMKRYDFCRLCFDSLTICDVCGKIAVCNSFCYCCKDNDIKDITYDELIDKYNILKNRYINLRHKYLDAKNPIDKKYNMTNSKILECKINDVNVNLKYKSVIVYIYEFIQKDIIIKNTILNIKQSIETNNGFTWYEKIGLSIQGVDANTAFKEIKNMSKYFNGKLYMKIKLANDTIIEHNQ